MNQVATNEANLSSADEVQTDGQKHSQHKRGGSTPVALEQTTKIFIETLKECVLTAQLPLSEYQFLVTDSYAVEQTRTHTHKHQHPQAHQTLLYTSKVFPHLLYVSVSSFYIKTTDVWFLMVVS